MKIKFLAVIAILSVVAFGCKKNKNNERPPLNTENGKLEVTVSYEKQSGTGSNQYAVWIENANGRLIKTLYVTDFTADGGYSYRHTSLPTWVSKANPVNLSEDQIDAISGSTPSSGEHTYTWDLTDHNGNLVEYGEYVYFVEGTYLGENQVMFKDNFTVGSDEIISNPRAQYSSDEMKNRDMIKSVKAKFTPKK